MTERRCAHHQANPAIAICSACERDICGACHRNTLIGFALCAPCEHDLRREVLPAWEGARSVVEYAAAFPTSTWRVMTGARRFYSLLPPSGGWLRAAVFGVIARSLGFVGQFGWSWLLIPGYAAALSEGTGVELTSSQAVLLLLAMPVVAPVTLLLHALMLWASLRVFGARARLSLALKICGYSSAAYLFYLVPPISGFEIGRLLATFWLLNIELIAVRRYFQELSHWRVMGVVLLPFLAATLIGL